MHKPEQFALWHRGSHKYARWHRLFVGTEQECNDEMHRLITGQKQSGDWRTSAEQVPCDNQNKPVRDEDIVF